MHGGVIEAVVALVAGGLTEAAEVLTHRGVARVVLARDGVQLGDAQAREHLLREIELRRLRKMRDVPGVSDQRRLLGQGVDQLDAAGERGVDGRIRLLVETDVGVADLPKSGLPAAVLPRAAASSSGVNTPPARVKRVPAPPKAGHRSALRRESWHRSRRRRRTVYSRLSALASACRSPASLPSSSQPASDTAQYCRSPERHDITW
jgi:hypothetical protein